MTLLLLNRSFLLSLASTRWLLASCRGSITFVTFCTSWIDVSLNNWLFLLDVLRYCEATSSPGFSEHLLDSIDLRLSETAKLAPNLISQISVQLNDTFLGGLTNILKCMDQSYSTKVKTIVELLFGDVTHFRQDPS